MEEEEAAEEVEEDEGGEISSCEGVVKASLRCVDIFAFIFILWKTSYTLKHLRK